MPEEELKSFISRVKSDPSLREQFKAEGVDVVGIAKAAGFALSEDDVRKLLLTSWFYAVNDINGQ